MIRSVATATLLVAIATFGVAQPKIDPKDPRKANPKTPAPKTDPKVPAPKVAIPEPAPPPVDLPVAADPLPPALAVPDVEVPEAVREKIEEAKRKFRFVMMKQRGDMIEAFEKKETEARDAGDKKAVDRVVAQRAAFEKDGTLPTAGIATNVYLIETDKAKRDLTAAYTDAIKECVRAKADKAADFLEKEKADLLKGGTGTTAEESTPAEITARARLAKFLAGTTWVPGRNGWTEKYKFSSNGFIYSPPTATAPLAAWAPISGTSIIVVSTDKSNAVNIFSVDMKTATMAYYGVGTPDSSASWTGTRR